MGVCVPVTMNDTRRSNVQSLAARVSLENVQGPASRGGAGLRKQGRRVATRHVDVLFCNGASTPTGHTEVEITAVVYDSKLVDYLSTM